VPTSTIPPDRTDTRLIKEIRRNTAHFAGLQRTHLKLVLVPEHDWNYNIQRPPKKPNPGDVGES